MGARKPDGGSARTERVSFTRPAAERIAKVVRTVEQGNRASAGLSFNPRAAGGGGGGKVFRVCTFIGEWPINSSKTVTLINQATTPNTVSAINLFFSLPDNGLRNCAVAKEGSQWYLLQTQWDTAAFVASAVVGTEAIEFPRYAGLSLGSADTVYIAITTCATAAI